MPPQPSCICGECARCRKRKAQHQWKKRRDSGIRVTTEERSAAAQTANRVRWGNRTRAAHRTAAEKLVYDRQRAAELRLADQDVWTGPGPSDEDLDRRAAEMLSKEDRCNA